jgi:hypothetical protein
MPPAILHEEVRRHAQGACNLPDALIAGHSPAAVRDVVQVGRRKTRLVRELPVAEAAPAHKTRERDRKRRRGIARRQAGISGPAPGFVVWTTAPAVPSPGLRLSAFVVDHLGTPRSRTSKRLLLGKAFMMIRRAITVGSTGNVAPFCAAEIPSFAGKDGRWASDRPWTPLLGRRGVPGLLPASQTPSCEVWVAGLDPCSMADMRLWGHHGDETE